jgi:hypothetical protein
MRTHVGPDHKHCFIQRTFQEVGYFENSTLSTVFVYGLEHNMPTSPGNNMVLTLDGFF